MHVLAQIPYFVTVSMAAGLDAVSILQVATNGGTPPAEETKVAAIDLLKEQLKQEEKQTELEEKQAQLAEKQAQLKGEFWKDQERILAHIVGMDEIPGSGREVAPGAAENDTRVVEHVASGRVLGDIKRTDPWAAEGEAHTAQNHTQAVEHIAGGRVLGDVNRTVPWVTTVETLDLAATDRNLRGCHGGFTDGTYGYLAPYIVPDHAGGGKIARFDLAGFAAVAVLDTADPDHTLVGFFGGFTDGTYGYLVPGYNGNWHGKVPRFDLASFAAVEAVLDLAATDTDLTGFNGGFTDGTYGYLVPFYARKYQSKVARFDLAGFAAVAVLDLATTDTDLTGFIGGFTDGTYGYVVPYVPISWHQHGGVARFDLAGFATVAVLNLHAINPAFKGYHGGFTDGTYGYLVPWATTHSYGFHGNLIRFDLAGFATVAVLDLAATDPDLKGYHGGFTDGTYGYLVPYYNKRDNYDPFHGKVARFDLAGFAAVAVLDLAATDPDLKGFWGGFTDSTYGYVVPHCQHHYGGNCHGKVARFRVSEHVPPDFPGPDADYSDQSSVVGDPHVVSVARAEFEIRADGVHKLVQVPQRIHANGRPDLRVDAQIQHLVSGDCTKAFMTLLSIFGAWTEDTFGLLRVTPGSDTPNTTLLINTQTPEEFFKQFPMPDVKVGRTSIAFKVRDINFHVGKHYEGRYGRQQAYLNVRITGLKKYKDLGGLLGYDDHADAEKPTANCTAAQPAAAKQSSLIGTGRSAPTTDGGSRIEAE